MPKEQRFQLLNGEETTIKPMEFNLEPRTEGPGAAVRMIPFENGEREIDFSFIDYNPPGHGMPAIVKIEINQNLSRNPDYVWIRKDEITLESGMTIPLNTLIGFKVVIVTSKNLFRGEFVLI